MARRPDLEKFAKEHNLKIGTIADLIHYRVSNEKTIERVAEANVETEFGEFKFVTYHDNIDEQLHYVMIKGDILEGDTTLVRVHMQNTFCDLLGTTGHGCHWPLRSAMKRIADEGGALVILSCKEDNQDILRRIEHYNDPEKKPKKKSDGAIELRTYGVGAQILSDIGVSKMRVLSAPMIMHGLSGFGLEVVEYLRND
jgi:3,4-dihydroxy 2-butanone 4-phosphate synthase/GTP cyclohydrolase II